jgi:Domain of unknown function (DUF3883)
MPGGSWLTAVRLERLLRLLIDYPRLEETVDRATRDRMLWRLVGGPIYEVDRLVGVLVSVGVLDANQPPRRTRIGHATASAARRGDRRPLGRLLVRSGVFHDQARMLLELAERTNDGSLMCPTRAARQAAPQLVGLLQWWPDVQIGLDLRVPEEVASEFNAIWALMPPPVIPPWVTERKAVGDRAEMYTVQRERDAIGAAAPIRWVSRETDALGWDVEDASVDPIRVIEVKGSRSGVPSFIITGNEWAQATEIGSRYEIHFWGGIDLNRDPTAEYVQLQNQGYPIVIADPVRAIASGAWSATPDRYRITRGDASPDAPVPAPDDDW